MLVCLQLLIPTAGIAQNPIIQTSYTPDPAPYVHNDTVYMFVDHDEDEERDNMFNMKDWQLYTSTDMVNWTYRGTPMNLKTFAWAYQDNDAWAAQAVERNGKWYWYVAIRDAQSGLQSIGVATADHPEGPWTDPVGKPLAKGSIGFIDPSVFVDDDGRAYLFWGNNGLWMTELGDDMISFKEPFREVDTYDEEGFGPHVIKFDWGWQGNRWKMNFEEAPWIYKVGDTYYLEYASGGIPEKWSYSTAKNIRGPWKFGGEIMSPAENSFTIHGGSIDYHGRQFMVYHNGILPKGHSYHRSTAIEEYHRSTDGTIPFIPQTREGVKTPVRNLNPYARVEAETMAWSEGVKTDNAVGRQPIHYISVKQEGYTKVRCVDFGKRGAKKFSVNLRGKASTIELRLDSKEGALIGKLNAKDTKGEWKTFNTNINKTTGVHDLYIIYKGEMDVDWWKGE